MTTENRRVLVIDDNPSIHVDFRKILQSRSASEDSLSEKEALMFHEQHSRPEDIGFDVDSAYQGDDGVAMIASARRDDQPFALAFVDVRMPPGIDGVETIERIWHVDPDIQLVICSAYSDYAARDILLRVGVSDRLLLLRKPCDSAEILMIASALCKKWNVSQAIHS